MRILRKGLLVRAILRKLDGGHVALDVTATAAEVNREFEEARAQFAYDMLLKPDRNATLDECVREEFGIADLNAHVAPNVPDRLVPYALDKHDLCPIDRPVCTYSAPPEHGKPFEFVLEVVPKPVYELSSYEGVDIEVDPFVFDESLVEERMARIVDRFVEFEPIPNRPVRAGDHCFIAMNARVDGADEPRLSVEGRVYSLGKGFMPSPFDEGLVGMQVGETRTIAFDAPFEKASGSSANAHFECTVELLGLRRKVIPSLADDWVAENMQGFSTVAQVRESYAEEVEGSERAAYERSVREQALAALGKRFDGQLPEAAFDNAYNALLADLKSKVRLTGKDFLEYVDEMGGEEQVDLALTLRAQQALAQDYSLDALFRHHGLKIEDADIRAACAEIDPYDPEGVRFSMEQTGRGFALREVAARHRATRWLMEHSHIRVRAARADEER